MFSTSKNLNYLIFHLILILHLTPLALRPDVRLSSAVCYSRTSALTTMSHSIWHHQILCSVRWLAASMSSPCFKWVALSTYDNIVWNKAELPLPENLCYMLYDDSVPQFSNLSNECHIGIQLNEHSVKYHFCQALCSAAEATKRWFPQFLFSKYPVWWRR